YTEVDGTGHCVENVTAELDSAASPVFKAIRDKNAINSLDAADWAIIRSFIGTQLLRTPWAKSLLVSIASALRDSGVEFPPGSDAWGLAQTSEQQSARTVFELIKRGP